MDTEKIQKIFNWFIIAVMIGLIVLFGYGFYQNVSAEEIIEKTKVEIPVKDTKIYSVKAQKEIFLGTKQQIENRKKALIVQIDKLTEELYALENGQLYEKTITN